MVGPGGGPYAARMALPPALVPRRDDVLLAAALVAISQVEVWGYGAAGGGLPGALTLGLAAAAMLVRSRQPVIALVLVTLGLTLCARFAGEPVSATSFLTFVIAMFSVGAMPRRWLSVATLLVAVVLSAFAIDDLTLNNFLGITLSSIVTPWLLGLLWLRHRATRDEHRRREEAAREAVAAERLRLAQELHDVVSHNVGMIAVQAGAADVLLDKDPAASRTSLHSIEEGARATLLELRRLLGLLRDDDPEPRAPAASLGRLSELVEPLTRAGVQVDVRADGDPLPLRADVEIVAYRVVQESLTNVVAHAGPCRVTVTLRYEPDALAVEVSDDGTARPDSRRGGYGLTGLRERVEGLGGTVTAGPRAEGGFRVHALLPLAAA
jgi:signal transduction histidine kinase